MLCSSRPLKKNLSYAGRQPNVPRMIFEMRIDDGSVVLTSPLIFPELSLYQLLIK